MSYSRENNPWVKDWAWKNEVNGIEYLISTQVDLIDIEFISGAFGSDEMYWARTIPKDQIAAVLALSTTLGLYKVLTPTPSTTENSSSSPQTKKRLEMVGMARFITDHITTAYLTDVYILPKYRELGLGRWLIACCNEIMEDMPAKRRGFLMTSPVVGKRFYSRELGFWDVQEEQEYAICTLTHGHNVVKIFANG